MYMHMHIYIYIHMHMHIHTSEYMTCFYTRLPYSQRRRRLCKEMMRGVGGVLLISIDR